MSNSKVLRVLNEESIDLERNQNHSVLDTKSYTVALYKTVMGLIINDIVSVNTTRNRIASVNCWEQLDAEGNIVTSTPATYSGKFGTKERKALIKEGLVFPTKTDFKKGDYFIVEVQDAVVQALKDNPFDVTSATSDLEKIEDAMFFGTIRYASEPSKVDGLDPSETSFRLRSWRSNVGNRRTVLEVTAEGSQDISRILDVDTENTVISSLAYTIASDINKDIIHTLMNISTRYQIKGDNGLVPYLSVVGSTKDKYVIGRDLFALTSELKAKIAENTNHTATFVVVSPSVAGYICDSGMASTYPNIDTGSTVKTNEIYILRNGLIMVVDMSTKFDYMMVGVKHEFGNSLYLSNFVQDVEINDGGEKTSKMALGTFNIVRATNPKSMSDLYLCLSRYALSASPYTYNEDADKDESIVWGDKWEENHGKSPLSYFVGIKLPKNFN